MQCLFPRLSRQGLPVRTVETRLRRGLERLRAALDDRYGGDGRAWIAALQPWMGTGGPGGGTAPDLRLKRVIGACLRPRVGVVNSRASPRRCLRAPLERAALVTCV